MRGADLDADADADAMQVDGDATRSGLEDPAPARRSGEGTSATGWTIRGIVKKKIVFSKRPMPVMAKKLQASS